MKMFETPVLEIEKFTVTEVITTSASCETNGGDSCDNETEMT